MSESILLNFEAGGSTEVCGCIEIIDDTIREDTENFLIRLSASGVTIEGPDLVTVEIEDDEGEITMTTA